MNKEQFLEEFREDIDNEDTINLDKLGNAGAKYEVIPIADRGFEAQEVTESLLIKLDEGIIRFNGNFIHMTNEANIFNCREYDYSLEELHIYTLEEIKNLANIDYTGALIKAQKTLDKLA